MKRRLSVACYFILGLVMTGCGGSSPSGTDVVLVTSPQNGLLIAPGESATLQLMARDGAGRPLPGRSLRVTGPAELDVPALADGSGRKTIEGVTNGEGVLEIAINRAVAGRTLLSVLDLQTGDESTVALNVVAGDTPALTPNAATLAVRARYSPTAATRLHGPALLAADEEVWLPDEPGFAPPPLRSTGSTRWLFWVDQVPGARFSHPTRIIVLDAEDAAEGFLDRATVTDANFFPYIDGPERANAYVPLSWRTRPDRPVGVHDWLEVNDPVRNPAQTGALLLGGPDTESAFDDINEMRDFLVSTGRVAEDNVFSMPTGVNKSSIRDTINALKEMGFGKLYVYYSGHGSQGAMVVEGANGKLELLYYDTLGHWMSGFPEVSVVIDACHSATAIEALQNLGLQGEIVTASNDNQPAWTTFNKDKNRKDGAYTRALLKAWRDPRADRNGDGVITAREAAAHVIATTTDKMVLESQPVSAGIGETEALPWEIPTVRILKVGNEVKASITCPAGLPTGAYVHFTFSIADGSIATAEGKANGSIVMRRGENQVELTFQGVADGFTNYTVNGRAGTGARFTGQGLISVGSRLHFVSSEIILLVGQSESVELQRLGAIIPLPSSAQLRVLDNDIVGVTPGSVSFAAGANFSNPVPTVQGRNHGVTIVSAKDEENDLVAELLVTVHQMLTLDHDLFLGGVRRFRKGDQIRSDRITGYVIWAPHPPYCDHWHLHAATPAGIYIDGDGPYPDPAPGGCGYGLVLTPPGHSGHIR